MFWENKNNSHFPKFARQRLRNFNRYLSVRGKKLNYFDKLSNPFGARFWFLR